VFRLQQASKEQTRLSIFIMDVIVHITCIACIAGKYVKEITIIINMSYSGISTGTPNEANATPFLVFSLTTI
jgi:hypothetical protein